MTITTMDDHGRRRQKCPPSAPHQALSPTTMHPTNGGQPPKQAGIILGGLRGCIALKTLQCWGNASLPEQRSILRATHHLNPPPNISACLGGCRPSVQRIMLGLNTSFGVLWGHFRRGRSWLWWSLCVFWSVPEHEPLFPVEPRHIGYRWKALVSSKRILAL